MLVTLIILAGFLLGIAWSAFLIWERVVLPLRTMDAIQGIGERLRSQMVDRGQPPSPEETGKP